MSPSNVLSYLRPHHRRSPSSSNPTSPVPSQLQQYADVPLPPLHPDRNSNPVVSYGYDGDTLLSDSPVSPVPPMLPPIPRVASRHDQKFDNKRDHDEQKYLHAQADESDARNNAARNYGLRRPKERSGSARIEDHDLGINRSNQPNGDNTFHRPHTRSGPLPVPSDMATEPSATRHSAVPNSSSSASAASHHQPYAVVDLSTRHTANQKHLQADTPILPLQQGRNGKTKLNLLNPMSLLMRRRSSQPPGQDSEHSTSKSLTIPAMTLPDGYDPRIRGKVIHDFSAPRKKPDHLRYSGGNLRPNATSPMGASNIHNPQGSVAAGPNLTTAPQDRDPENNRSGERNHTPIFKEDFGEDVGRRSHENRSESPLFNTDPAIVGMGNELSLEYDRSTLPPFARNLPPTVEYQKRVGTGNAKHNAGHTAPSPPRRRPPEIPNRPDEESNGSDHAGNDNQSNFSDIALQPSGLPKHLRSNASRFSFDLASVGSDAQEKLLEDKHRKNATVKRSVDLSSPDHQEDFSGDEEALDMYDDFDEDDGGLEEKIPGVNADAEEYGDELTTDTVTGFNFQSPSVFTSFSPISPLFAENEAAATPRDGDGKIIGFALSKESPPRSIGNQMLTPPMQSPVPSPTVGTGTGLGINGVFSSIDQTGIPSITPPRSDAVSASPPQPGANGDDLYYDDGMIEHPEDNATATFDETFFDDDEASRGDFLTKTGPGLVPHRSVRFETPTSGEGSSPEKEIGEAGSYAPSLHLQHQVENSLTFDRKQLKSSSELTADNLTAYHDALVAAANAAAAKGDFQRQRQSSIQFENDVELNNSHENGPTRPSTVTRSLDGGAMNCVLEDVMDSSDDMDDDAMVAAANAEALANDADGFYGQEFGFYAHSSGSGETDFVHGGYFGPKGADGLGRSQSGRIVCREPNLTPITERSEYSNRNSFISLHLAGGQTSQSIQSPGLAQLAGMMGSLDEEDLSLDSLMKLRRGAWGGSNGSLRSAGSAGSTGSGSPLSYVAPLKINTAAAPAGPNASTFTLSSSADISSSNGPSSSDDGSLPNSPTVTMTNTGQGHIGSNSSDLHTSSSAPSSPATLNAGEKRRHSRNVSGADSVSYATEEDEAGTKRWILEKRRTSGTGQVEILGREIVAGGRI
ncbi:MAG: hypothetical protein M1833_004544 [Piccolia ochrophora]|nr:MAG: hypothetical protein M1833_004544 [Piccolia ochrophora]